tara:strand:+ start:4280 stop:5293 length:1014 start_codon:yes stop_codon:yes gene_type:complete
MNNSSNENNLNIDTSEKGFNVFDIIFFAWERKFKYFLILIILGISSFYFLAQRESTSYLLNIKLSAPNFDDIALYTDYEAKFNITVGKPGENLVVFTPDSFRKNFKDIFQNKRLLQNAFLKAYGYDEKIKDNLIELANSTNINKLKYEDPVEGPLILNNYWEIRISHSNRDLLEIINQKLIGHIEFFAFKNISSQYRNILQKRVVDKNPEIKRIKNEIDIIGTLINNIGTSINNIGTSINNIDTQTYSKIETDYSKMILNKKLELAYWENLNIKGLLSELSQLNEKIINKPIYLIADKQIAKSPTKNKRNFIISLSIAIALSLFILLIDIESKKRRT